VARGLRGVLELLQFPHGEFQIALVDYVVAVENRTRLVFRYLEYNNNPPAPDRVFRKLVRAGDVCERDLLANLEAWPSRLKRSI